MEALSHNKAPLFNSRYNCPNSSGIDAFQFSWSGYNNWAVPPPRLIPSVLRHAKLCRANVTLLIPRGEGSIFWPLLLKNGRPLPFVKNIYVLPNAHRYLVPGPQADSILQPYKFNGEFIVLRLCFI